jgi:Holliday junction resolvase
MKEWEQSELDAVKVYNGKRVPGSGCFSDSKLDVIFDLKGSRVRLENKFTIKDSFSLKKELIKKAARQAMQTGDKFLIRLDLSSDKVIVMTENMFRELIARIPEED